jgi:hypothetical protein
MSIADDPANRGRVAAPGGAGVSRVVVEGQRTPDVDLDPPGVTYATTVAGPPVTTYVPTDTGRWRRDRVRWSAVWAGLLVTVSVYIVLQLALIALGVIDVSDAESADAWWSAAAALVAFFVGGLTTGATAMWNGVGDGVLHGVIMWALAAVGILVLSVAVSGLTLGALDTGGLFETVTDDLEQAIDGAGADVRADDAEEAASWVLLGLGAAVAAAVVGGSVGSKMWDGRDDDRTTP